MLTISAALLITNDIKYVARQIATRVYSIICHRINTYARTSHQKCDAGTETCCLQAKDGVAKFPRLVRSPCPQCD